MKNAGIFITPHLDCNATPTNDIYKLSLRVVVGLKPRVPYAEKGDKTLATK